MPVQISIKDQMTGSDLVPSLVIEYLTERVTVRELIRARIYQEVQDYNRSKPGFYRGLVQPTDAEATLNGYRLPPTKEIDWQIQYDRAIDAFNRRSFLVLIGDQQAVDLDQEYVLTSGMEITFLKLLPLVGG